MSTLKNVWVVDDDPIARLLIRKLLERENMGQGLRELQNGQQALDAFLSILESEVEEIPPLILLDLNMPVMDGWGFLDACCQNLKPTKTKIIVLTSSINPQDEAKAESYSEIKGFLRKPLNIEELKTLINN